MIFLNSFVYCFVLQIMVSGLMCDLMASGVRVTFASGVLRDQASGVHVCLLLECYVTKLLEFMFVCF
jgi:accessory gene regulator protein AgrB